MATRRPPPHPDKPPPDRAPCFAPNVILRRIVQATDQLIATAAALGDDDMRADSLLPGWTRGHVLTHLARNADGGTRLLTWARTGRPAQEYPSLAARATQIEAGADRGAADLVADVRTAAERFVAEYRRMPTSAWRRTVRWTAGQERPAARIADARLCEVLVHHVDLRAGFTPDDWPAEFVLREIGLVVAAFRGRADAPAVRLYAEDAGAWYDIASGAETVVVRGPRAALLAWLMGRSAGESVTAEGRMGLPVVPFLY